VSPTSSTAFTLFAGSSNQVVTIGNNSIVAPIAGYRFQLNAPSSGVGVTLAVMQSGIGLTRSSIC